MKAETIQCGSGMPESVRAAMRSVLRWVVPAMFRAQQPWAIMGSTASVLQGIDNYVPPDIDLVTTAEGAYIMEACVVSCGTTVRPVSFSVSPRYSSHFGIFQVEGVKVEIMGDLVIYGDDGIIAATEHFAQWSDKVRIIHFEEGHIPVVSLEWQLVANVLLRRPERSDGIAELLMRRGFDRAYIETILTDRKLGARTIAAAREALHLDA